MRVKRFNESLNNGVPEIGNYVLLNVNNRHDKKNINDSIGLITNIDDQNKKINRGNNNSIKKYEVLYTINYSYIDDVYGDYESDNNIKEIYAFNGEIRYWGDNKNELESIRNSENNNTL